MRLIHVALTYGDQIADAVLTLQSREHQVEFAYREALGLAVRYEYTAYMSPNWQELTSVFRSGAHTTARRLLVIAPELYQRLELMVVGAVSFQRYPKVIVDIQIEDASTGFSMCKGLFLRQDMVVVDLAPLVPRSPGLVIKHRVRWFEADRGVIAGPWEPTGRGTLVIGDPSEELRSASDLRTVPAVIETR